jgi:hypothetical protein
MRKLMLSAAALGFLIASYQGALGADSTAAAQGQVRLVSTDRCNLVFQFRGFAPGTMGRLQVNWNGTVSSMTFRVPSESAVLGFGLHGLLGHPSSMVQVGFKVAVEGMDHVMSAVVTVNCDCGGGGGGSGAGGGGSGGSGSDSSGTVTSVSSASAAGAISGQPGFAG